jgi:hypothetical protein
MVESSSLPSSDSLLASDRFLYAPGPPREPGPEAGRAVAPGVAASAPVAGGLECGLAAGLAVGLVAEECAIFIFVLFAFRLFAFRLFVFLLCFQFAYCFAVRRRLIVEGPHIIVEGPLMIVQCFYLYHLVGLHGLDNLVKQATPHVEDGSLFAATWLRCSAGCAHLFCARDLAQWRRMADG